MRFKVVLLIFWGYFLVNTASANTKIKLATFIEPPMIEQTGQEYGGEFIDIMKLLSMHMNLTLEHVKCPIARCLMMMKSGDADIIIGVKKTPARLGYLSYLSPHLYTQDVPLSFYSHINYPQSIYSYDDLKDKTVGVLRGAAYFEPFDSDFRIHKVNVTRQRQLVDMLLKQRINTFIEREESISPLLDENEKKYLKIEPYKYTKHVLGYIAISRYSAFNERHSEFSAALQELISNGAIDKIFEKYQIHHH